MLNTVDMADDYFSTNYFGAEEWAALTVQEKQMLIEWAENDVTMALRSDLDPSVVIRMEKPYTLVQKAIFEWALYIHRNKSKLIRKMNNTSAGVISVEVDGVGKETYATTKRFGDTQYMSCFWDSRAGQLLSLIDQDIRIVR